MTPATRHPDAAWYHGWWPFTEGHEPWYRRWWLPLAAGAATVLVITVLATLVYGFYRSADVPPADELRPAEPTVVYDARGERVATLDPAAVRRNVDLADLPDHVWQAVLAAEDRGFFDHPGFSMTRILAAFKDNLFTDDRIEGGSTITQQYVEVAIREVPRTYLGKLREVVTAYKVEREYSKEQILEFYLNSVRFGRGTQGISAASLTYFRKSARELDVEQAALLAGMIAAPTRFAPSSNPELAEARRDYTLRGMVEQGWLADDRARELIGSSLPEVHAAPPIDVGPNAYYLDVVRTALAEQLPDHRDPFLGLEVHTALSPGLQQLALDTLNSHLEDQPYTGSIVSIDPRNGAVRTIVGGRDHEQQQFNIAVQGRRQPGSAFKTMTLSAFVGEGWSPQSRYDGPAEYTIEREDSDDYTVHNFANRGWGRVNVRMATINSINTVYAQMQQDIGTPTVMRYAHRLGIDEPLKDVPSLTLGTVGVSPYDMASAYATLAAQGTQRDPYVLTRVVDRSSGETVATDGGDGSSEDGPDGEQPTRRAGPDAVQRGIEPNTAAVVTDVLADNVERGTGTAAQIGRPAAGKTGTTQEFRDAWFVGYVPQLTTAVWIGNADNTPMDDVTGSSIPAETWGDYMRQALEGVPVVEFPDPEIEPLELIHESDDEEATASPTASATATSSPSPTASATGGPSPTDGGTGSRSPSPSDGGPLPTIDETRTNRTSPG